MKIEVTRRTVFGFAFSLVPDSLPGAPTICGTVKTLPQKIAEDAEWQASRSMYKNRAYYVKHDGEWHRFSFANDAWIDQVLAQGDPIENMCCQLYDIEHSYFFDRTGAWPVQTTPLYIELKKD